MKERDKAYNFLECYADEKHSDISKFMVITAAIKSLQSLKTHTTAVLSNPNLSSDYEVINNH